MKINWFEPKFGEKENELVTEVLRSGMVSEGEKTKKLEKKLAKIVGTKHVIMTTSCTAALYLAIKADMIIRGYSEGHVVIPDLTFVGTRNAVEIAGLNEDIQDVDDNRRYLLDTIGLHPDVKIAIIVNLLGRGYHEEINNSSYDAPTLIYDNAGALGSNVPNGKVGCYSLQANKMISTAQGGFCATDDDEYAQVIREQKDQGRHNKLDNDTIGFNLKYNDIQAAVALGQLEKLEERKELHKTQYLTYQDELEEFGSFIDFDLENGEIPLWVEFFPKKNRNGLVVWLENHDISCRIPWKPFELLPNAKHYYENCVWLPNGPGLKSEDQSKVIKLIKEFYN